VQELENREHHNHILAKWVAGTGAIAMVILAGIFHWKRRDLTERVAMSATVAPVVGFLHNKWKVDELYDVMIRKPLRAVAWITTRYLDSFLLDRTIIDKVAGGLPKAAGALGRTMQRGSLQGYALTMGLGIAILMLIILYKVVNG
jgi:NADH-quinone oxidoreductase subunit L